MTRSRAAGYTLLEVVLSLVLTTLVLLCVAMAVDAQLRIADVGRTHVEEAQLARVLLHRIADDVRNAAVADPLGLDKLIPSVTVSYGSAATATTEGEDSTTDESMQEDDSSTNGTTTESTTSQVTDPTQGMLAHTVPGLYGGTDWIEVDVDRPANLARITASAASESSSSSGGVIGDLKTVAYYVVAAEDSATQTATQTRSGLLRREVERAMAESASGQAASGQFLLGEKLLAPEVASLQFRYSDGSTWSDTWDTSQTKTLPLAVEITLTLQSRQKNDSWATELVNSTGLASTDQEGVTVFRLIVDIPMAKTTADAAAEEASSDTQSEASGEESSSMESSNTEGTSQKSTQSP